MTNREPALPIEAFIQAISSQLDRAQAALRLKAHHMPMTFAVKDLSLDLRAHVEVVNGAVCIRSPAPGDAETSVLRMSFTTITRPVIEENTMSLSATVDEPSLKEVLGDKLAEEEQRRLEWAGIQTVSQLRDLESRVGEHTLERIAQVPAVRLRQALRLGAQPRVRQVTHESAPNHPPLLRVRGYNLMGERPPAVSINGKPATVLQSSRGELLVEAQAYTPSGIIQIEPGMGQSAEAEFRLDDAE